PVLVVAIILAACAPASQQLAATDDAVHAILSQRRTEAIGHDEPFTVERPADLLRRRLQEAQDLPASGPAALGSDALPPPAGWPVAPAPPAPADAPLTPLPSPLVLSLAEALAVGARNSREYQTAKEEVFRAGLDLNLAALRFTASWAGTVAALLESDASGSRTATGLTSHADLAAAQQLTSGLAWTASLAVDLVRLLTLDRASSLGLIADATITLPLLAGSGRDIVREPLTQAEREVTYALWAFEEYKRRFAVDLATDFLNVLQAWDVMDNAAANHRRLAASAARARRLGEAGRLSEIQVSQAVQNELRARSRLLAAQEALANRLDQFKIALGLPADAALEPDRQELHRLLAQPDEMHQPNPGAAAGHLSMEAEAAVRLALAQRLDLRVALGRVEDAQRAVLVAADALRPGADLVLAATAGEARSLASASLSDARLRLDRGLASAALAVDLPLDRRAEVIALRARLLDLEAAIRAVQALEDEIKAAVRADLAALATAGEEIAVQTTAVALAERRVASANLFLEAGRAQIRDLLDAQDSLLLAQNARTAALVSYRLAELALQRDLGALAVDSAGLWQEYRPGRTDDGDGS
ncbi:MAG: TolC family protein, partial [Thermodesulfobacteriota bacterium]